MWTRTARICHDSVLQRNLQSRNSDGQTCGHIYYIPSSVGYDKAEPLSKCHRSVSMVKRLIQLKMETYKGEKKSKILQSNNQYSKKVTVLGFEPRFPEPQSGVLTTIRHRPCSKTHPFVKALMMSEARPERLDFLLTTFDTFHATITIFSNCDLRFSIFRLAFD